MKTMTPKEYLAYLSNLERVQAAKQKLSDRTYVLYFFSMVFLLFAIFSMTIAVLYRLLCMPSRFEADAYKQPAKIEALIKGTEATITWITFNQTAKSVVWYGTQNMDQYAFGTQEKHAHFGRRYPEIFIHRVTLTGLKPNENYSFKVGSPEGYSRTNYFKTPVQEQPIETNHRLELFNVISDKLDKDMHDGLSVFERMNKMFNSIENTFQEKFNKLIKRIHGQQE